MDRWLEDWPFLPSLPGYQVESVHPDYFAQKMLSDQMDHHGHFCQPVQSPGIVFHS